MTSSLGLPASGREAAAGAKDTARRAADSKWVERMARVGIAARGLVYVLIAFLAVRIAFGDHDKRADQAGAFQTLAETGWGKALLWLVAAGLVGYALWELTEAALGHREDSSDGKRTAHRAESAAKAVLYLGLALVAARVASGGSGGGGSESLTARVLGMSGGRLLVGLAGLVVVGIGVYQLWGGVTKRFEKDIRTSDTAHDKVVKLGQVGHVARGAVVVVVGLLVVAAAVTFDPAKARGLDAALSAFAAQPYGPLLLVLVALGLLCFGVYSFVESRLRRL